MALVVLHGAGHSWPGADPKASIEVTDDSVSASRLMAGLFLRARSSTPLPG